MRGGVLCSAGGKECGDDEGVSFGFLMRYLALQREFCFFFFSVLHRVLLF